MNREIEFNFTFNGSLKGEGTIYAANKEEALDYIDANPEILWYKAYGSDKGIDLEISNIKIEEVTSIKEDSYE